MGNKTRHFNYHKTASGTLLVLDQCNKTLKWKVRHDGLNRSQLRSQWKAWKAMKSAQNQETASMEAIRKAKAKRARRKANKVASKTRKQQ